jgi:ABC-type dipeptide/oligopeptide/nickel transport system ATPase component
VSAYPHELSGGMAQRALISMALSVEPDLLIADEPTSGLDVTIQAQFLDRMWERARDANIAVLIVTQDVGIVANYCDRIVIMEDGKIIECTKDHEILTHNRGWVHAQDINENDDVVEV